MKYRAVLPLAAVIIVLLITWGISINSSVAQERERNTLAPPTSVPKCSLSRVCPPNHIALRIRSGAADIVGPTVCFAGKIIMSHALNNVGPGLNIAVINGETGVVEKSVCLNMKTGDPKDILAHLKKIKRGMIVLVASFDDVTQKMTNEMREIFSEMGSTLIRSVKRRDSWVFAGRAGTKIKSLFEKQAVNDEKNNIYGGWPEMVEVGGCFPRVFSD
ncbi:protein FAM3C [Astatotilapia calliptera]|uniref:ILEI/PANDER domain-containing protein n=1 Tax=Astatotilapia calliptera TaxID=8154 RepID=A0A3P8PJR1_ASTCA|nr:protein FAM3C-like [Astatotilapia calliptera]